VTRVLARLRVPLGFVCGAVALWLARPTPTSMAAGLVVASVGEAIRVWAAGHIEKGREVTRSGPYRYVRHPLYVGSALMGAGFMWAAVSLAVAILVSAYLVVTLTAAIRSEEATLVGRFGEAYTDYATGRPPRDGSGATVDRPFSWARARANREHRAIAGLVVGAALLYFRAQL